MDLIDTPCPPPNRRRKRQRPPSPEPTLLADDVDQFTTEIAAAGYRRRLPPTSLAVAPKRRKIPLSLTQKKPIQKKLPEQTTASTNARPKTAESVFSAASSRIRRMSTRSQTCLVNQTLDAKSQTAIVSSDHDVSKVSMHPSSPAMPVNSSILHADVSDIDSTSTTIMPHSSPNVSANISAASISAVPNPGLNPPSKKRRRISELVRRVASAAVARATSTNTKPKPAVKQKTAPPPKPTKSATSKPVEKRKPATSTTRPASQAIPPKKPTAKKPRGSSIGNTSMSTAASTRPALKQVTRGMNPPVRSVQTDSEQPKKSSTTSLARLRLQKTSAPKAFSDTEYTKRTRVSKPSRPTRKSASEYAKLEYSLKPELYDTAWLDSQEGVLEQLANDILSATVPHSPAECEMRESLIDLYNSDEYCMLLERLKASILHGVLKPTDDQLDQHPKLGDDLGMRDRFAKLFTQTYNPQSLRLGMEVVTGRSLGADITTAAEIQRFFETFFVDIEDDNGTWESYSANAHGSMRLWTETETAGSNAWTLRRIIQRSLLLVKLLDHGKTSGIFPKPLFQASSDFKSSEAILTKLLALLLPTLGNAVRSLKNCKYTISHVQKPEEEFTYTITNLKVDLRTGTRLAKLAELLSPPSPSQSTSQKALSTVSLLPRTRVEKIANNAAVLNYLYATNSLPANSIKPSDIVDGHREVTLSVLWALVAGKVGLKRLVNWSELDREIRRLWRKYRLPQPPLDNLSTLPLADDAADEKTYLCRLDLWVHAMTTPRNISCANAATTFTNGDIITAILDEYQPLHTNHQPQTLSDKLKSLGCSTAFLNLFTPKTDRIVNDNFVIASLAFLASRILASTARIRAALTIQHWWRASSLRRHLHTKIQSLITQAAADAAAAEHARRVAAATVIQRAWRAAVSARVVLLTAQLTAVQALARGHLVRRKMDYRFRADGGREERVKGVIEALKKAREAAVQSDPYALNKDGGEAKAGRKRRRKVKVVEEVDIWQDLAEVEE
ncbi:hypothetical protein TWF696_001589 [Orbilia brochopaga]|uniref:Calponin-homology (CH) domain-containing protein n=1 Tax=Orbilia brochopaga TaxID=3140254 RepID=A0AAV9UDF0_9PEZI